jgi:hypothetical protein
MLQQLLTKFGRIQCVRATFPVDLSYQRVTACLQIRASSAPPKDFVTAHSKRKQRISAWHGRLLSLTLSRNGPRCCPLRGTLFFFFNIMSYGPSTLCGTAFSCCVLKCHHHLFLPTVSLVTYTECPWLTAQRPALLLRSVIFKVFPSTPGITQTE